MLSEDNLLRIEELKKHYPSPRSVVLEALWMWQDEHGWVSQEGMQMSQASRHSSATKSSAS